MVELIEAYEVRRLAGGLFKSKLGVILGIGKGTRDVDLNSLFSNPPEIPTFYLNQRTGCNGINMARNMFLTQIY